MEYGRVHAENHAAYIRVFARHILLYTDDVSGTTPR